MSLSQGSLRKKTISHNILFPLLSLPVVGFAVLCHLFPNMALNGFIGLSVFQIILGLFFYKKGDVSALIFLIFLEGLALKLFYITYTPYHVRQHDMGSFSEKGNGHFNYIYYVLKNHTLPFFSQTPNLPICHPPLHYVLSALFLTICPGYENLQYTTVFLAFGCSVLFWLVLKFFVKEKNMLILLALFCSFFPALTFYSGSLNGDILNTFLITLSVYLFLMRLRKNQMRYLLWSSFILGLAGMVKLQALAVYLGVCLFYLSAVLMKQIKFKKALRDLTLFSVICLPMIFIWPVYIYIRWSGYSVFKNHSWLSMKSFRHAFKSWFSGYNPFLHINNPYLFRENSGWIPKHLYVGAYSLFERLGLIFQPLTEPYLGIKRQAYVIPEYNIWMNIFKTALFDSARLFSYGKTIIDTIGFWLSVGLLKLLCGLSIFFVISFFRISRKDLSILYCQSIIVMVMAGFLYWSLYKAPVSCASSFRYIAFLLPCVGLFVVKYVQENLAKNTCWNRGLKGLLGMTVFLFSWISLVIYTLYGATAL